MVEGVATQSRMVIRTKIQEIEFPVFENSKENIAMDQVRINEVLITDENIVHSLST